MTRARTGAAGTIGLTVLGLVAVVLGGTPADGRPAASAANSSRLSTTATYTETVHGVQHGAATTGVRGHGTFAVRAGGHAVDLALMSLATGIPFGQIAHGGSFGVELNLGATGTNTGTVVARFKAHRLGSLCFAFTAKGGRFQPGASFVPTSGTVKVLGGTGQAAKWQATGSFALRALTGAHPETFGFAGTARGTVARTRQLSRTCRSVASLAR